jgi:hypothetical protein
MPYVDNPDLRRDEWATVILPKLKVMPLTELQRASGLSRAALQAIRAGRRPHARNRERLRELYSLRATHRTTTNVDRV